MKNAQHIVMMMSTAAVFACLLCQVAVAGAADTPRVVGTSYSDLSVPVPQVRAAVRRGGSHPHMNNLVFGRRSSPSLSTWKSEDQHQQPSLDVDESEASMQMTATLKAVYNDLGSTCQSIVASCARLRIQNQFAVDNSEE